MLGRDTLRDGSDGSDGIDGIGSDASNDVRSAGGEGESPGLDANPLPLRLSAVGGVYAAAPPALPVTGVLGAWGAGGDAEGVWYPVEERGDGTDIGTGGGEGMRPRGAAGDGGELRLTLWPARGPLLGGGGGGDGDATGGERGEKAEGDDGCGAGVRGTGGDASGELGVERVRCRGGTGLLMLSQVSMPAAGPARSALGGGRGGGEPDGATGARGESERARKRARARANGEQATSNKDEDPSQDVAAQQLKRGQRCGATCRSRKWRCMGPPLRQRAAPACVAACGWVGCCASLRMRTFLLERRARWPQHTVRKRRRAVARVRGPPDRARKKA